MFIKFWRIWIKERNHMGILKCFMFRVFCRKKPSPLPFMTWKTVCRQMMYCPLNRAVRRRKKNRSRINFKHLFWWNDRMNRMNCRKERKEVCELKAYYSLFRIWLMMKEKYENHSSSFFFPTYNFSLSVKIVLMSDFIFFVGSYVCSQAICDMVNSIVRFGCETWTYRVFTARPRARMFVRFRKSDEERKTDSWNERMNRTNCGKERKEVSI